MFRAVSRSSKSFASVTMRPSRSSVPMRSFADKLSIPTDSEQQAGRRKEELDAEAAGEIGFNKDPIIPAANAGTKENPILVPSAMHARTVGYEDPYTHQLVWFNLEKGPLHYIPDIGLYFQLKATGDEH